jgi:uncharacterized protein (DUF58 family)
MSGSTGQRFRGAVAATLLLATAGLLTEPGPLLLAAVVPLGYLLASALRPAPDYDELSVTRHVDVSPAPPGEPVLVRLTVENDGDTAITDLRIVDGVPGDLRVLRGSPRAATALAPGETVTLEYRLVARRGDHDFADPTVAVRGLGAGSRETTTLTTAGDTQLVCRLDATGPPIGDDTSAAVGQIHSDRPGRGVAFHSTREYRHGDAAKRIDWRHYAKRGTLATVNYTDTQSAAVVFVMDARSPSYAVSGPGHPTAITLEAYAATHACREFADHGHDVGLAVVGLDAESSHWVPPDRGAAHRSRLQDVFELAADATGSEADDTFAFESIQERVPADAQIVLLSPFLDDAPVRAVDHWRATGTQVTILSPDVLPGETVSGQDAQVRRGTRLARCQAAGARAVDWRRGTRLPAALSAAFAKDSASPVETPPTPRAGGGG